MMAKVSVLMPVYRTDEAHLRAAVESVLSQTFADFEFLIQDDCPEDSREAVARSYRDPRIVYEKSVRNEGIAGARNRLIGRAKGEYLAVFDHDDVCRGDRLEKEVAWLDAHPDCGVVSSWVRHLPYRGVGERCRCRVVSYPEDDCEVKVRLVHDCIVQHSAAMVRRSALDAFGVRYEPAYSPSEDHALWVRLLPHVGFHIIPEPLLDYRWHANNVTRTRAEAMRIGSAGVQALARATVPDLCQAYYSVRDEVVWLRIFGVPFIKVVTRGGRSVVKLFDFLPVGSIRRAWR